MNDFDKRSEFERKLKDLNDQQKEIQKEKEIILSQRPWFSKSQNIIALLAIIIPIIASLVFKIIEDNSKELSIEYYESQSMLVDNTITNQNITVNFDSLEINNISTLKVVIKNSGDIPIKITDFTDGPLRFTIEDKFQTQKNKYPFLLNVYKITDSQQKSKLEIIERRHTCDFTYLPSLLNPDDIVEIGILLTNEPHIKMGFKGKIDNGEIFFKQNPVRHNSNNLEINKIAKTIISFFRDKTLSIPVSILVLLLIFIANISFWLQSNGENIIFEPSGIGKILAFLFSVLSVFAILFGIILFFF